MGSSMLEPNLAGFREAQARLIDKLGADVEFTLPATDVEYPPDTPLDPESGEPYDPTIEPISGGPTTVTVKATVIERRGSAADEVELAPVGWIEGADVAVKVKSADRATIDGTTHFLAFGEQYAVRDIRPSGLNVVDSYFVYGAHTG